MRDGSRIEREVDARQVAMFEAFVGPGRTITRAALAAASGIHVSTLASWAAGASMPLHGALALALFLPREAINMMTEPAGCRLVDIEIVRTNWDTLAASAAGFVAEVCEARRDGFIDHVDHAKLKRQSKHMIAELSAAAEDG